VRSASSVEIYDRDLGPVIFEPFTKDLARRVRVHAAEPVLEIACDTGMFTEQLRARLSPAVGLLATDLNEPMIERDKNTTLEIAKKRGTAAGTQVRETRGRWLNLNTERYNERL